MELIGRSTLAAYEREDRIAALLARTRRGEDAALTCQKWLEETPAKRLVFERLYGDLIDGDERSVLDVGGGLTALTRVLAARRRYTLVDILAHDSPDAVACYMAEAGDLDLVARDWGEIDLAGYDVVVANDLFPNVDQRLGLFLERCLPVSGEVRLSLTFYNQPRWYFTKRIDGDEKFCVLAFDGRRTRDALAPFANRADGWAPQLFDTTEGSVFANGRQVLLATFKGDQSR